MYKLEYLEIAKKDIDNIVYYIRYNLKNKTAAITFANELIKETDNILKFPYGNIEYTPLKPLKNKYRQSKFKNFIIFYIVNEKSKTITITRVLYQKRNFDQILN